MSINNVLVLGIDGMDPRFTKYMLDNGELPNIRKYIEKGACREDLVLLGGVPTITPPMWTTLATGAYPNTHGVTCFWNQHEDKLDTLSYAMDSRVCKAEQVWNIFAEAGKKTMVWHWPGGSWPPSSDSPNLSVVDGAQPPGIHNGIAIVDKQTLIFASDKYNQITNISDAKVAKAGAGCVIEGMEVVEGKVGGLAVGSAIQAGGNVNYIFKHEDGEAIAEGIDSFNQYGVPLTEPTDWQFDIPDGAKEMSVVTCKSLKKYPALVLKNENDEYDQVVVYKNKKDATVWFSVKDGEYVPEIFEDIVKEDGTKVRANRQASIIRMEKDGSYVELYLQQAMEIDIAPSLWHPQSLYQEIKENVGVVPPTCASGGSYPELIERKSVPCWDYYCDWQAKCLNYLIKEKGYEVIFSHNHSVDAVGHHLYRWCKDREEDGRNIEARYQESMKAMYRQADRYVGEFLYLLDEGWQIYITSDHGLLTAAEDELPLLGEGFGLNMGVMMSLGYTVLKKGEDGRYLKEIDWEKTTAVAPRGNHIYINLKGRNSTGIVDPDDKYALETKIIDDLYAYRMNGKRVVKFAMRNKDAAIFGMSGPLCGDIIYFIEEGYNRLHGDSWSTTYGYFNTSVSPIFIAAGNGIKENYKTEHVIRQTDFAPTVATLAGIRLPAQSEGVPAYDIMK